MSSSLPRNYIIAITRYEEDGMRENDARKRLRLRSGFGNVAPPQDANWTSPMCLKRPLAGLLSLLLGPEKRLKVSRPHKWLARCSLAVE